MAQASRSALDALFSPPPAEDESVNPAKSNLLDDLFRK